ncbi:hypothetical protein PCANC_19181 [Puccinia coronata f. sp. avenae]|uniref:Uncharacterized protein n=1 Tax=Puccinia coronata f. sp. avenae TaxID=200324 RepID=A0A2N5U2J9_9BASI|nr:hypothetical protein PCANC_19181 [Puccinia coronata f. sp. avenae]PLW35648.1 hypothetical protein PCASD_10225 [Puccinia coronata f. sp. avenae]
MNYLKKQEFDGLNHRSGLFLCQDGILPSSKHASKSPLMAGWSAGRWSAVGVSSAVASSGGAGPDILVSEEESVNRAYRRVAAWPHDVYEAMAAAGSSDAAKRSPQDPAILPAATVWSLWEKPLVLQLTQSGDLEGTMDLGTVLLAIYLKDSNF